MQDQSPTDQRIIDVQCQFVFETKVESNELLGVKNIKYTDKSTHDSNIINDSTNTNDSKVINNADASNSLDSLWEKTEVNEPEGNIKSDIHVDGDSRSYRKHNLRQAPKFKIKNLNENKLLQFSQSTKHGIEELKPQKNINRTKAVVKSQENEKNIYTCMCCETVFDKGSELVKHKEEHKNECYACNKCNISFSSQLIYLKHIIYEHMKPPYRCRECLFKTKGLQSIITHIKRHSTEKIECGICKNKFYFYEIGTHKQSHNNTKYECGECGAIKENKASFDYHMISHAGVKKYQCLYCGKGYAHPNHLRVHTKVHTNDPNAHECDECGKKYRTVNSLWYHKAGSHSKKVYECDHCGRKLKSKISIEQHLLLHSEHKPYKCPECPLSFHTKTHLRVHTYSKHIEDRFKCELCSRSFSTTNHYKRHLQSNMHKNNIFKKEKLAKK